MLEIRVLTGLYRGAVCPLLDEALVIGSSNNCTLTLSDEGVCAFHLTLSFNGTQCFLEKQEGEVLGLANERLTVGQTLLPKSPFRIGTVWLMYTDSNDEWLDSPAKRGRLDEEEGALQTSECTNEGSSRDIGIPAFWKVGVSMLVLLPVVLFLLVVFAANNPGPNIVELEPPTPILNVEESLIKLNRMLDERGLSLVVETKITDGKEITMTGNLMMSQYGVFTRMIRRFQHDYISLVTVVDDTQLLSPTLPFDIVTVVAGPHSHVVTGEGDILFIGEEKDGYRLSEIRQDTVFFVGPYEVNIPW